VSLLACFSFDAFEFSRVELTFVSFLWFIVGRRLKTKKEVAKLSTHPDYVHTLTDSSFNLAERKSSLRVPRSPFPLHFLKLILSFSNQSNPSTRPSTPSSSVRNLHLVSFLSLTTSSQRPSPLPRPSSTKRPSRQQQHPTVDLHLQHLPPLPLLLSIPLTETSQTRTNSLQRSPGGNHVQLLLFLLPRTTPPLLLLLLGPSSQSTTQTLSPTTLSTLILPPKGSSSLKWILIEPQQQPISDPSLSFTPTPLLLKLTTKPLKSPSFDSPSPKSQRSSTLSSRVSRPC